MASKPTTAMGGS